MEMSRNTELPTINYALGVMIMHFDLHYAIMLKESRITLNYESSGYF